MRLISDKRSSLTFDLGKWIHISQSTEEYQMGQLPIPDVKISVGWRYLIQPLV